MIATGSGTDSDVDWLANELLTLIEHQEAGLINWGFYEGTLDTVAEAPLFLAKLPPQAANRWAEAQAAGLTERDLIDNLIGRQLLLEGRTGHRTRFAEAIRLLARLRQLFPNQPWTAAPTLVGDLRVVVNPRRYPARDVESEQLLTRLSQAGIAGLVVDGVRALLTEPGGLITLAAFQERATLDQLQRLAGAGDRGIVIGAGTGAGKTKAFYVPALAHIAANITDQPHVQALAVYPRIELLKDQFLEAHGEARKLDGLQQRRNRRSLNIGAYYGDTPRSATELWETIKGGRSSGWACPFFRCQKPGCDGREFIWRRDDLEKAARAEADKKFGRHERLACPSCGDVAAEGTIRLTREGMLRQPPDVLFVTAEMLNRRLTDGKALALLGVDAPVPPRLLLLDEIHTYEGLTGAQTAYLLRRWRYARSRGTKAGLCIVGLSATLSDAENFFAQLTGLGRHQITYVQPAPAELIEEGGEYNVAVKGDPVSGAQLLSTSVQTAMLIGRILDPFHANVPAASGPSHGAYGRRIFAFTDQLDAVNRWHHIELDAETRQCLARLRAQDPRIRNPEGLPRFSEADQKARLKSGQIWWLSEKIGHRLDEALQIALVSSQYQLTGAPADLVIATSSLEVGYNDAEVGAVIQHKAPKSLASFLQRKGRAGRTRAMRPWTVVVVSSFGRDRWAFQHAEELFRPELRPIELPTENVYVQKIQGTFALMDWLAAELKRAGRTVNVWELLAGNAYVATDTNRGAALRILNAVLAGPRRLDLERYLARALGLRPEQLEQLLWGDPRSLMFEAIPTLTRQLESTWSVVAFDRDRQEWEGPHPRGDLVGRNPMPDFVPPTLFSDLNLPELLLRFTDFRGTEREESLDLLKGLWEYAPGRVSKRFADKDIRHEAHWLAPPLPLPESGDLSLDEIIDLEVTPQATAFAGSMVQVYRPRVYRLQVVPPEIKSTSMGRLHWQSLLTPRDHVGQPGTGNGAPAVTEMDFTMPVDTPWAALITGVAGYEHRAGRAVEVVRAGTGVTIELGYQQVRGRGRGAQANPVPRGQSDLRRHYRFVADDGPAAIGFTVTADGLGFSYRPLDVERLLASEGWTKLRIGLAPEAGKAALHAHPRIRQANLNPFEVDWLWEIEVAMLTAEGIVQGCPLDEAAVAIDLRRVASARNTLDVIFQVQALSPNAENDVANPDPEGDPEDEGRRKRRLLELEADDDVIAALRDARRLLWSDDDPFLRPWLSDVFALSLGAAIQAASLRLVPDLDPETLVLDVTPERIWLTESTGGGVGHVVKLARAIRSQPRAFTLLLDDATWHCDRDATASSLETVAATVAGAENPLAPVFARIRESGTLHQQDQARALLLGALEDCGVPVTRELVVNINAKFLRDLSGHDSDALLAGLVRRWRAEEDRLGCAIDLRTFAVAAWQLPEFRDPITQLLARIGQTQAGDLENQVYNVLQSMLWLTCPTSCPDCIETWSRFAEWPKASRALVRSQLPPGADPIRFGAPGWAEELAARLGQTFAASVRCEHGERQDFKASLTRLMATPVDTEFQVLYPVVERIGRDGRDWIVSLIIRELANA